MNLVSRLRGGTVPLIVNEITIIYPIPYISLVVSERYHSEILRELILGGIVRLKFISLTEVLKGGFRHIWPLEPIGVLVVI